MHYYLQLSEGNPKTDPITLCGCCPSRATLAGCCSLAAALTTRRDERRAWLHQHEGRAISDCHFAVQLNHFIPGFLSYSVAVFLK
jgi:hypothetical protein